MHHKLDGAQTELTSYQVLSKCAKMNHFKSMLNNTIPYLKAEFHEQLLGT